MTNANVFWDYEMSPTSMLKYLSAISILMSLFIKFTAVADKSRKQEKLLPGKHDASAFHPYAGQRKLLQDITSANMRTSQDLDVQKTKSILRSYTTFTNTKHCQVCGQRRQLTA